MSGLHKLATHPLGACLRRRPRFPPKINFVRLGDCEIEDFLFSSSFYLSLARWRPPGEVVTHGLMTPDFLTRRGSVESATISGMLFFITMLSNSLCIAITGPVGNQQYSELGSSISL